MRWPLQPWQALQKTQLQPPFGPSVNRSAIRDSQRPTSPIGFLSLKLPPPPCAVLLVQFMQALHAQDCELVPGTTSYTQAAPTLIRANEPRMNLSMDCEGQQGRIDKTFIGYSGPSGPIRRRAFATEGESRLPG